MTRLAPPLRLHYAASLGDPRARVRRALERVDAELVAWHEHNGDRALPLEYRRYPRVPDLSREELHAQHAALIAQLTHLP